MAILNLDMSNIDPTPRFDPLPAGEYPVIITASEMKFTKNGDGQYLELTLEVQGGEFAGRKLFDRLNLHNTNRQAVEIAQRQLSQICHAVGFLQVQDSEQLHYKPLVAIVRIEPGRDGYEPKNVIKGYKAAADNAPVMQNPAAQPAQQQAPRAPFGAAAAPWAKATA